MRARDLRVRSERWPLARPFRISRGMKTEAEVVVVELHEDDAAGRGESVPYARYGESAASVMSQIESLRGALLQGLTRAQLLECLPAGAARNAVDCALWDLEAQRAGTPSALELQPGADRAPVVTALTISLDAPAAMAEAARGLTGWPLIKVKVDASDPAAQIRRVREACPSSTLIVDPNESWTLEILRDLEPALLECRVALLEQPLPAQSEELEEQHCAIPICADESCHTAADLPRLAGRFQLVNIKLDKTGGLTAALALLDEARRLGFGIMTGCMICTSLSIAPALHVARRAHFVDLDGPLWLSQDRGGGIRLEDGRLCGPQPGFWGEPHGAGAWR